MSICAVIAVAQRRMACVSTVTLTLQIVRHSQLRFLCISVKATMLPAPPNQPYYRSSFVAVYYGYTSDRNQSQS